MSKKKLLLFFIDGIGLGPDNAEVNPIRDLFSGVMAGTRLVEQDSVQFFNGGVLIPTDAVLGVPGLPQSATGQTSIFTGINAQKLLGHHLSAYPNERLKSIIEQKSLMRSLKNLGVKVTAANLYSREFFDDRKKSPRNRFPVSTLTIQSSGAGFRFWPDYQSSMAVFADITNERLKKRGYDIPLIEPEEAAANMLNILLEYDFVFFEYFMTDLHGHKRNRRELSKCVDILNRFTGNLREGVDRATTAILILSDHGNAEDMTTGDHTLNRVPTLFLGADPGDQQLFAQSIRDLTDIHPTVLKYFS